MRQTLEAAVIACAKQAATTADEDEALKFTQAALNAVNAIGNLSDIRSREG